MDKDEIIGKVLNAMACQIAAKKLCEAGRANLFKNYQLDSIRRFSSQPSTEVGEGLVEWAFSEVDSAAGKTGIEEERTTEADRP